MIKDYIFNETISGFNEDVVIANKPGALLHAKNADLESQPGSLRKRGGFVILGEQLMAGKKILGLHDFVSAAKTHTPVAVVNLASDVNSKQVWLSPVLSGLTLIVESGEDLITEDGFNLIT
jgi:hypothetical protein